MSYKKALLFVHFFIGIAGLHGASAIAKDAKVDVCHIPPGNPANAHTITISENAVDTHLEHGDTLGPCDAEPAAKGSDSKSKSKSKSSSKPESPPEAEPNARAGYQPEGQGEAACACPRPGVWRVTNLDGYMECNVMGIKRKLRGAGKNDGAIWILNDDCSTIFSEAYEKDREDVLMDRGRECLFFGVTRGEEEGAEVIFDGAYKLENEEFITGEYYMQMDTIGADCSGYRPFEINFLEPLSEKDYAKLEKKMNKQLDAARATLDQHREQIDRYLEDTDGGKAFGGRNAQ